MEQGTPDFHPDYALGCSGSLYRFFVGKGMNVISHIMDFLVGTAMIAITCIVNLALVFSGRTDTKKFYPFILGILGGVLGIFMILQAIPAQALRKLFYPLIDPFNKILFYLTCAVISACVSDFLNSAVWLGYIVAGLAVIWCICLVSMNLLISSYPYADPEDIELRKKMHQTWENRNMYQNPYGQPYDPSQVGGFNGPVQGGYAPAGYTQQQATFNVPQNPSNAPPEATNTAGNAAGNTYAQSGAAPQPAADPNAKTAQPEKKESSGQPNIDEFYGTPSNAQGNESTANAYDNLFEN